MVETLAIVIVLNVAVFCALIYRHVLVTRMQRVAKAVVDEAQGIRYKASVLYERAQKAAILAEHEGAHEVCSECSKIVTRYEKDFQTAKITCVSCMEKLAREAHDKI